jgi:hypothetical protein
MASSSRAIEQPSLERRRHRLGLEAPAPVSAGVTGGVHPRLAAEAQHVLHRDDGGPRHARHGEADHLPVDLEAGIEVGLRPSEIGERRRLLAVRTEGRALAGGPRRFGLECAPEMLLAERRRGRVVDAIGGEASAVHGDAERIEVDEQRVACEGRHRAVRGVAVARRPDRKHLPPPLPAAREDVGEGMRLRAQVAVAVRPGQARHVQQDAARALLQRRHPAPRAGRARGGVLGRFHDPTLPVTRTLFKDAPRASERYPMAAALRSDLAAHDRRQRGRRSTPPGPASPRRRRRRVGRASSPCRGGACGPSSPRERQR